MPSMTCLVILKTESRLVRITASQSALLIFLNVVSFVIPALLTRLSMGPMSFATHVTHSLHESKLATSTPEALNLAPPALGWESQSLARVLPGEWVTTTR